MKRNLYLLNGKDYWLIPRIEKKEIVMKHIQSQMEQRIQFATKADVKLNYSFWLKNQEIRLPNTFLIRANEYTNNIIKSLKSLGIFAPKKSATKKYILFHNLNNTFKHIHLDEINETLIPIITYKYIRKVTLYNDAKIHDSLSSLIKKSGVGLFADQVF